MWVNKKLRKINYNYNTPGIYFITICTKNRKDFFGKIENRYMIFSAIGTIAERFWKDIPLHFKESVLHNFVIMPNHIHGIIELTNYEYWRNSDFIAGTELTKFADAAGPEKSVGAAERIRSVGVAERINSAGGAGRIKSVGVADLRHLQILNQNSNTKQFLCKIIHGYKSSVTRECKRIFPLTDFHWQRSFYDVIIKSKRDYYNICNYIDNNIANWESDFDNV